MTKSSRILTCRRTNSIRLECEIDLKRLFDTGIEKDRFEARWKEFLKSDPYNSKIFKKTGNRLAYRSEQLIPKKQDGRPPLLLVFGNPAGQSVANGMFFSSKKNGPEHRFWRDILTASGILELSYDKSLPAAMLNKIRRKQLLDLAYDSPFRIGLCVLITLPSAPGGPWGGVAGVQKLIGARALRKLEQAESARVLKLAAKFVDPKGAAIAFQKNAWNSLRSAKDPEYSIGAARAGLLQGTLKGQNDHALFGVPPTRLPGPCCRALTQIL